MDAVRPLPVLALLLAACLGTSPEDEARRALGPEPPGFCDEGGTDHDDGEEDEDEGCAEHRPGQPCLVCHDDFAIAGTVFLRAGDGVGVEGADVLIADDRGHLFAARTNRTGNFMVEVDGDLRAPRQRERGRLSIPWKPVFPLQVAVRHGELLQVMESRVHREGSCGACHTEEAGAASAGPVYVLEEAP